MNHGDCTADHPNNIYKIAERGEVLEMFSFAQANAELKVRLAHYVETHDVPFIVYFMEKYGGAPLSFKMPGDELGRIARYIDMKGDKNNMSLSFRQIMLLGLDAFEQQNKLPTDMNIQQFEKPEDVPSVEEQQMTPTPIVKTGIPVAVPVRKIEPEPVVMKSDDELVF